MTVVGWCPVNQRGRRSRYDKSIPLSSTLQGDFPSAPGEQYQVVVPTRASSIIPSAAAAIPGVSMTHIPTNPVPAGRMDSGAPSRFLGLGWGSIPGIITGVKGAIETIFGGGNGTVPGQPTSTANPPSPGLVPTSGSGPCIPPYFRNSRTGQCELDLVPGPGGGGTGACRDDAHGHNGRIPPSTLQGSSPFVESVATRHCGKGSVLGDNGLCYDKRTIPNSRRMWPKPTRPLGTTGEMNAVSKAAAFGRRLKGKEKSLKRLGRQLGGVGR
jgi:hypothetical protein